MFSCIHYNSEYTGLMHGIKYINIKVKYWRVEGWKDKQG